MDRREVTRTVKKATVAVIVMQQDGNTPFTIVGSGFCVDADGIIVTCKHVMEAMMVKTVQEQVDAATEDEKRKDIWRLPPVEHEKPWVVFYVTDDPENVVAVRSEVISVRAKLDYDLAALRIAGHVKFRGGYPFLATEQFDNVREGDEIGICGFPLGNHLAQSIGAVTSSFSRGIISSIIPAENTPLEHLKGYHLDIAATHGNSGGPVFHIDSGKVLAVLSAGVVTRDNAVVQGLAVAEPIHPIIDGRTIGALKRDSGKKP